MEQTHLVVGLGNFPKQYHNHRHNIGYKWVSEWVTNTIQIPFLNQIHLQAVLATHHTSAAKLYFLLPQTYMNLSGIAVVKTLRFFKLPLSALLVVYDEINLPVGKLKLSSHGSAGGHNGMQNIITHCQTQFIKRCRIGIGKPVHGLQNHVLSDFHDEETATLAKLYSHFASFLHDYSLTNVAWEQLQTKYNQTLI